MTTSVYILIFIVIMILYVVYSIEVWYIVSKYKELIVC